MAKVDVIHQQQPAKTSSQWNYAKSVYPNKIVQEVMIELLTTGFRPFRINSGRQKKTFVVLFDCLSLLQWQTVNYTFIKGNIQKWNLELGSHHMELSIFTKIKYLHE